MKRILKDARCVILGSLILLIAQPGWAVNEWLEFYNNTRTLSMGGASVAITSDDTSLWRNPANLGSIREVYGTLLDPEIEGTSNLTPAQINIKDVMDTLASKPDTYYRLKGQLSPTIVRRNIGFGLIAKNEISAEIKSSNPSVMDTAYVNDVGAALGINLRLFDGRIKIGAVGRYFNRIEVINPALSTSGPTDLETIASAGSGFAVDGGLLLQAPWTLIPTLGVVVRDIGGTKFTNDSFRVATSGTPMAIKQSVDAAIAVFPIHSNTFRSVWTLEYTDITNSRNDTDTMKRVHAGIEFNARDVFFFRAGYNQRYWTAGIEVASEYIVWQLASYGEEIGTEAAPREDRRINTKLAIRF